MTLTLINNQWAFFFLDERPTLFLQETLNEITLNDICTFVQNLSFLIYLPAITVTAVRCPILNTTKSQIESETDRDRRS